VFLKTIKAAKFAFIIVPILVPTYRHIGKPHGKTEVVCYAATHVVCKKIYVKTQVIIIKCASIIRTLLVRIVLVSIFIK